MVQKVHQWQGFCLANFFKKDPEGKPMFVSVVSQGELRKTPEEAWADAMRFEGEHEAYAKKEKVRITTMRPGICPTGFL